MSQPQIYPQGSFNVYPALSPLDVIAGGLDLIVIPLMVAIVFFIFSKRRFPKTIFRLFLSILTGLVISLLLVKFPLFSNLV